MGIIVEYVSVKDEQGENGIVQMPAYKTEFDHKQTTNNSGRQNCCNFCHACHRETRQVLDGELWCGTCEKYL